MSEALIKKMESFVEIEGKAKVHAQTFRETYAELLAFDYLKEITFEKCLDRANRYPENTLIAKVGEKVIGFVCYGQNRDMNTESTGEIFALYLLKDYRGKKIGFRLLEAALEQLSHFPEISLWVLEGNKSAISFYEKVGFEFTGKQETIRLGEKVLQRQMLYKRKNDET